MSSWRAAGLRSAGCVFAVAAIGAGVGLAAALQAVARHGYPSLGLWRTSLWMVSRGLWLGAALGAASGAGALLLSALSSAWPRRRAGLSGAPGQATRGHPLGCPPWKLRLVLMLALLTAGAVLATPLHASTKPGLPYLKLAASVLALLWLVFTPLGTGVAALASERERAERWFRLRWLAIICFGYLVVFLHVYARAGTWRQLTAISVLTAAAFVLLHHVLVGPARGIHASVGLPFGRAALGRPGRVLALILLALSAGLWGAGYGAALRARAEAGKRGRSVILIGVDTLRADCARADAPGRRPPQLTPNMQDLAARGTVYANAVAQAPWTLASFASVFTGLYPAEHGAEHLTSTLAPAQTTLAEVLREAGYRTLGVASGEYVTTSAGMAQGFEVFDESQVQGRTGISSKAVSDKAVELLREHGHEPFFLFLHYFDPHWIYQDHGSYDFAGGYSGPLREPAATMKQSDFQEYLGAGRPGFGRRSLPPADLDYLRNLYHEDVAYTDAGLGRLFAFLDETGLWDSCLVILVADHGESFLEHNRLGHNNSLYGEEIHVPLTIAGPSVGGGRVIDRPVETRALFTTILDCAGVPPPPGRPSPPSLLTSNPEAPRLVRSAGYTTVLGIGGHRLAQPAQCWWTSVQEGRWKLIKEHLRGRTLLFDLRADPGETRNCKAEQLERAHRLERELDRLDAEVRRRARAAPAPEASEEQKRRLRSLGYL